MPLRSQSPNLVLLLLGVTLALWLIPFLLGHEPWNDEAYTFSLVYNVVSTGDAVVPRAGGLPFLEKPPLYFISAAVTAKLFAPWLPLHDGARLVNVLYLLLTVSALAYAARRAGNRQSAVMAVVLLPGCLGIWEVYHRLITDVALLSGFTLAIAGLVVASSTPLRAGILLGTGAGIAFMAKGLFGPGQLGLMAVVLPLCFAACRGRAYWISMAYAALFALPWLLVWPLSLLAVSPQHFQDWFWLNNVGRFFGTSGLGPSEKFGFYFHALLWQAWPVIVLAGWEIYCAYRASEGRPAGYLRGGFILAAALTALILLFQVSKVYALPLSLWLILLARQRARDAGFEPRLVACICFAVSLVVLSTASTSTDIYAIVLLPPLVLLATTGGQALPPLLLRLLDRFNIILLVALALFFLGCWIGLNAGFDNAAREYLLGRLPPYPAQWHSGVFVLALGICAAWGWLLWRITPNWTGLGWRWTSGVIALGLLFDLLWRPYIGLSQNYSAMIEEMERSLPERYNCIAAFDIGESLRGMIHYRTGIVVLDEMLVDDRALTCDLRLLRENQLQLAPEAAWQLVWRGKRAGDSKVYSIYRRQDERI